MMPVPGACPLATEGASAHLLRRSPCRTRGVRRLGPRLLRPIPILHPCPPHPSKVVHANGSVDIQILSIAASGEAPSPNSSATWISARSGRSVSLGGGWTQASGRTDRGYERGSAMMSRSLKKVVSMGNRLFLTVGLPCTAKTTAARRVEIQREARRPRKRGRYPMGIGFDIEPVRDRRAHPDWAARPRTWHNVVIDDGHWPELAGRTRQPEPARLAHHARPPRLA
jgi:hypothetical protein